MIPKDVVKEIKDVLASPNGKRRIQFKCNFSERAWSYVLNISDIELFTLKPPEHLSTKGCKKGQYKSECLICKKPTRFISYTVGYARLCLNPACTNAFTIGKETKTQRRTRVANTQKTMLARYGAKCSAAAGLQTFEHLHTEEVYEKSRATWNANYGTPGKRTGAQKQRLEEKIKRTNQALKETRLRTPGLYTSQRYQRKTFTIHGRSFSIQGYEDHAIKHLVYSGQTSVNTIELAPKGFPYKEHGRDRVYLPDFRAKISNKWYVVEVKSTYTLGIEKGGKTMFYNLRRKSQAVKDAGYRILTMVYNHKTKEITEIENIHECSIRQVRLLVNG